MSDALETFGANAAFDPRKRVHYTHGLVLGVDELSQEQQYFLARHQDHNRWLHGCGTASGLRVQVRDTGDGPEAMVEPGVGVLPSGQTVTVTQTQCAKLDVWLAAHPQEIADLLADTGGPPISLYIVLAHQECATDLVPIPGEACRTAADSSAPSRITDDFELFLVTAPPGDAEGAGLRRLETFLTRLRLGDGIESTVDRESLLSEVRGLDQDVQPPVTSELVLAPADANSLRRAVLRVWATEVRPLLVAADSEASHQLLLARLEFNIAVDSAGTITTDGAVTVDEEDRPILLPACLTLGSPLAAPPVQGLTAAVAGPVKAKAKAVQPATKTATKKAAGNAKKPATKKAAKTTAKPAAKTRAAKTRAKTTKAAKLTSGRRTKKKPTDQGAES